MHNNNGENTAVSIEAGLRYCNTWKIYRKAITDFISIYSESGIQVRNYLAAMDFDSAHRLLHTIKGSAGTLGAVALQEISASMIRDIRNGDIEKAIQSLDMLDAILSAALKRLSEILEETGT